MIKFFQFFLSTCLFFPLAHGMNEEEPSKPDLAADLRLAPYADAVIGKNVWLRPIFPQDAPSFVPIFLNPEKMKYFGTGRIYTREELDETILFRAKRTASYHFPQDLFKKNAGGFHFCFFNHKGPSGIVTIFDPKDPNYKHHLELAFCGQGGTSEAVKTLLSKLETFPLVATVHPKNKASVKILTENDFKLEKENIKKYGFARNIKKHGFVRDYYVRTPRLKNDLDESVASDITG